jgi:hypothetical protein
MPRDFIAPAMHRFTSALLTPARPALLTLFALVSTVLLPVTAVAEEATSEMGPLAFTVNVPEGKVSLKEVHTAVVTAAMGRKWTIKEDNDTKVVIYLLHRGRDATVTFLISEKSIEAYCVGYVVDKTGNRKKPDKPDGWLNNLKQDITKLINAAALAGSR